MTKKHTVALAWLFSGLVSLGSESGQIGEPAPALAIKEWVKGKPVEIKPGTNLYVLEIWATWSAGSRASLTNLSEMQKRYQPRGLRVAAISDEPIEKIKEFIEQHGTNIEIAIGADDQRQTARSYMAAVRQYGIPYAFLVGTNGIILWHGPPSGELGRTIDSALAGTYSLEQTKKDEVARHQMEQYLAMARRGDMRAQQPGRSLLDLRTNDVSQLCDLAFQIATHPQIPKRDVALANEALDRAEKIATTNTLHIVLTRVVLLFETGKREEALALVKQTVAAAKDPKEKQEAEACLRTMEARMKRPAPAKPKSPGTTNNPTAGKSPGETGASVTNASPRTPSASEKPAN